MKPISNFSSTAQEHLLKKRVRTASLVPRFLAFLADSICFFILFSITSIFLKFFAPVGFQKSTMFAYGLVFIMLNLYYVATPLIFGATTGKYMFHMKIVSVKDHQKPPHWLLFLARETVGRPLSGLYALGYLLALSNHKQRTLHDFIGGTEVISTKENSTNVETLPVFYSGSQKAS